VDTCLWDNLANYTALQWGASKGEDAYWVGGPRNDKNDGSLEGGYAFLETSSLPDKTYGAPMGYAYFDIFNTGSR